MIIKFRFNEFGGCYFSEAVAGSLQVINRWSSMSRKGDCSVTSIRGICNHFKG